MGGGGGDKVATYGEIIVEKIHGISEKLLGHHRSDSDTSARAKTGLCHFLQQQYPSTFLA